MYKGNKIIGLCISRLDSDVSFDFTSSLSSELNLCGYKLFVYHTCSDLYWKSMDEIGEKSIFSLMDYNILDTIIIHDESFFDKELIKGIINKAHENNVPVIFIGGEYEGCTNVLINYEEGFETIVRHVIECHGISDICFVAGVKGEKTSERRINVYKKILAENNIPFNADNICYGEYWWKPTQAAVEKYISDGRIPKAFICANDSMAITTCEILRKHGYRVPEDVIVTGFDHILESTITSPTISTCGFEPSILAKIVCEKVCDIHSNRPVSSTADIPFSFHPGGSCGCDNTIRSESFGSLLKDIKDLHNGYKENETHLYKLTDRLIASRDNKEFEKQLATLDFTDAYVMINKDSIDSSINPLEYTREKPFDEEVYPIYHNHVANISLNNPISLSDICPDFDKILETDRPVIFTALSYLSVPMGYVVFYFELNMEFYSRISQYVNTLNRSLGDYHSITYLKNVAETMDRLSKTDTMTGLNNRQGFHSSISDIMSDGGIDKNSQVLFASIDMDGLKHINDTYGHDSGDYSIKSIADAIKDVPYANKICARFGGDEFVVLAVLGQNESADALKTHVNNRLDELNKERHVVFDISASIGCSTCLLKDFNFEVMYKDSDTRMYNEKIHKRNRR